MIVGADVVAYGAGRPDGRSWGDWAKQDLPLDPARTHWLGSLQTDAYQRVLACSDVHFYLTVPFVLSWSLLEAMASGCCIVTSDTPPVREVLSHGESAVLVDFFSPEQQASAVNELLTSKQKRRSLSDAAREASKAYDSKKGLEAWMALMSVNSNQTAQRPGSGMDVGYKYCAVCLGMRHTPPPWWCGCERPSTHPHSSLPDDFELQLHYWN